MERIAPTATTSSATFALHCPFTFAPAVQYAAVIATAIKSDHRRSPHSSSYSCCHLHYASSSDNIRRCSTRSHSIRPFVESWLRALQYHSHPCMFADSPPASHRRSVHSSGGSATAWGWTRTGTGFAHCTVCCLRRRFALCAGLIGNFAGGRIASTALATYHSGCFFG